MIQKSRRTVDIHPRRFNEDYHRNPEAIVKRYSVNILCCAVPPRNCNCWQVPRRLEKQFRLASIRSRSESSWLQLIPFILTLISPSRH
jgi:hypothetical protein